MRTAEQPVAIMSLNPGDSFETTLTHKPGIVLHLSQALKGEPVCVRIDLAGKIRYTHGELRVLPRGRLWREKA